MCQPKVKLCICFIHNTIDDGHNLLSCGFVEKDGILTLPSVDVDKNEYLVKQAKQLVESYVGNINSSNVIDIVPGHFYDHFNLENGRNPNDSIHIVYEVYLREPLEELEFLDYGQISIAKKRIAPRHRRTARGTIVRLQGL